MLSDGSSDSANIVQKCVYLLYLSEDTPTVESIQDADAEGIHNALKEAFQRFGITNFSDHLVGLNVDGAAVNTGMLELSIKDVFERVDTFINQLYLLYGKSPKRLRELLAMNTSERFRNRRKLMVRGGSITRCELCELH